MTTPNLPELRERSRTDMLEAGLRWGELHRARTRDDLRALLRGELLKVVPFCSLAVLLLDPGAETYFVECVIGLDCPLQEGNTVDPGEWTPDLGQTLTLTHDAVEFGSVIIAGSLIENQAATLEALLLHFSVALTNLMIMAETNTSSALDQSSLRALEEGVVLFQCEDVEQAGARFLQLSMDLHGGQAGALLLLDEINNPDSDLRIAQSLGLPEDVIRDLQILDADGESQWWPNTLLQSEIEVLRRDPETGIVPVLDNGLLPGVLLNVVGATMRYHGVVVGVCVLLNVDDNDLLDSRLKSCRQFFALGAAVFHRMYLQECALRSKHIDTQLEIASVIQSRFLPESTPCPVEKLDVAWRSVMSASVGGDYLDFIKGEIGGFFATVSDVSGHGIDSALLMSSFRSTYRAKVAWFDSAELLANLNNTVVDEVGDTGMFLTAVTLEISEAYDRFSLSSAGHNDCLLLRAETGEIDIIESSGPPLGVFRGATYEVESRKVSSGDVLLLYTDGVVEATVPGATGEDESEMFGDQRLHELLKELASGSADEIVTAVFAAVAEHSGQRNQDDDVSVMALKFA